MAKLTVKLTRITKRNKAKLCIKNLTEYKWNENTKANENNEITKKRNNMQNNINETKSNAGATFGSPKSFNS